jgi:tetratricopeptide (TPR) repeat protein
MEKAIALGATDYQVQGNLAECYLRIPALTWKAGAAFREAIRLAEAALAVNPKNHRIRASLAFYFIKTGDRRRALAELERARQQAPDDGHVLFRSVLVHELAGDRDRAVAELEAALRSGYSKDEIRRAADLAELRKDSRYPRLIGQ